MVSASSTDIACRVEIVMATIDNNTHEKKRFRLNENFFETSITRSKVESLM